MAEKDTLLILLGAGAAIPMGGPSTMDLTLDIVNCGRRILFNNYENSFRYKLVKLRNPRVIEAEPCDDLLAEHIEGNFNFEVLLGDLEALYNYYSFSSVSKLTHESKLFELREELAGDKIESNIPNYEEALQSLRIRRKNLIYNEYADIMRWIQCKIIQYSHENNLQDNPAVNKLGDFLAAVAQRNTLRINSLNYDRIPYHTMKNRGLSCFDGFVERQNNDRGKYSSLMPKSIFTEKGNTFYNLHGSIYWDRFNWDRTYPPHGVLTNFPGPAESWVIKILLSDGSEMKEQINNGEPSHEYRDGTPWLQFSIISGLNKMTSLRDHPSLLMYSVYQQEVYRAKKVLVIGVSHNDLHISGPLRYAFFSDDVLFVDVDKLDESNLPGGVFFPYDHVCDRYKYFFGSNWNQNVINNSLLCTDNANACVKIRENTYYYWGGMEKFFESELCRKFISK